MPASGAPGRLRPLGGLLAAAVLAVGCGGPLRSSSYPRPDDCHIDVLPNPPGDPYVQVGELSLEASIAGPARYQYKSPYQLAADMRGQICAIGGDTLVTERDASGVIVRGTVYRRATEEDIPAAPRPPPSRAERCEAGCGPGFVCEAGTCVPQCDPACGDGATCGADRLCHPEE